MRAIRIKRIFFILFFLAYASALFLPALTYKNIPVKYGYYGGFSALFFGWGLIIQQANFAWLGNVFGLFSLILSIRKRFHGALYFAIFASVVGLQSLFISEIAEPGFGTNGTRQPVAIGFGFYVWEGALLLLLTYCWLNQRSQRLAPTPTLDRVGN